MSYSRLQSLACLGAAALVSLAGCGDDPASKRQNNGPIGAQDSGSYDPEPDASPWPPIDAGSSWGDGDWGGDGDSSGDGDTSTGDGDLGGDGDASPTDAGTQVPLDDASVPPPTDGGKWTLKAGSAPDCPAEPPPIPLLGGLCFGFYWSCGWENEAGEQYSCVCDLVHYICLPL